MAQPFACCLSAFCFLISYSFFFCPLSLHHFLIWTSLLLSTVSNVIFRSKNIPYFLNHLLFPSHSISALSIFSLPFLLIKPKNVIVLGSQWTMSPHMRPLCSFSREGREHQRTPITQRFKRAPGIKGSLTHGWLYGSALDHLYRRRPATDTRIPH